MHYYRGLEQIKVLTPVFISSIKVYVNMLEAQSPSAADCRDNRNYSCQCIYAEIEEIIRVLKLTSADEEDLDTDDAALIKRALVCIQAGLGISYGMNIYTKFNLVTWLKIVKPMESNISKTLFLNFNYISDHYFLSKIWNQR